MSEIDLEKKRAEARGWKGVAYDPRIDRFVAFITIAARKTYLGQYTSAEAAGRKYQLAHEGRPLVVREKKGNSFADTFENFAANARYTQEGKYSVLTPGQVFTAPDGQLYCLRRNDWMVKGKRRQRTNVWASQCRVCDALYESLTLSHVKYIPSMVRTCPTHRGKKFDKARAVAPAPENWGVGARPVSDRIAHKIEKAEVAEDDNPHNFSKLELEKIDDLVVARIGQRRLSFPEIDALYEIIYKEILAERTGNSDLI